jgi:hypothetical protein
MLEKLKNWFKNRFSDGDSTMTPDSQFAGTKSAPPKVRPRQKVPRQAPEFVETDEDLAGEIESNGPGKNVLIRNKFLREDTGTHETLKILDDSLVDSGEETGLDPYNTGGFDRSKNWDRRFGK